MITLNWKQAIAFLVIGIVIGLSFCWLGVGSEVGHKIMQWIDKLIDKVPG